LKSILALLQLYFSYYILRRTPVIVYSMERTGSVALHQTLVSRGVFTIATHYLNPERISEGKLSGRARWATRHVIGGKRRVKIITLVRNPVQGLLSHFARTRLADAAPADAQQIRDAFVAQFLESGDSVAHLDWFTSELGRTLEIDVFAHPFDKEAGWGRIDTERFDLLILRTELPDEEKARVLGDFLGDPGIRMVSHTGVGSKGGMAPGTPGGSAKYGAQYEALKKGLQLPEEHLRAIAATPLCRHFIRDEELAIAHANAGD